MHILVTADTLGGVWTYVRELVTGLVSRDARVTLVSFGDIPSPSQMEWMEDLPNLDYRPTAFKLEWMQDSEADLAASTSYLETLVRECKPDLLHLNQFYYGALECDTPRIVVAHSDVVSWWVAVHGQEPPYSPWLRWYREIVTRGLAAATMVVAPSRWMLEQTSRYYALPAFSSVIYNGRTPALFNPHLTKDDLIVTVGRQWDRGKNTALLLQREMPAPVCIVGSDRHPESRSNAFVASVSAAGVHFEPQQNEKQLAQVLGRAGIYAATSCYEPFGLAPLEAAFSRCALVVSDIPSLRELWDSTAIFFHNNDSASLCASLEYLVRNTEMRREYGNLAYERARQRFSANRMVDDYLKLYTTAIRAAVVPA